MVRWPRRRSGRCCRMITLMFAAVAIALKSANHAYLGAFCHGRRSSKACDWPPFSARARGPSCAVEEAFTVPGTRLVCIREIQKSLAQSVKHLIESKIEQFGHRKPLRPRGLRPRGRERRNTRAIRQHRWDATHRPGRRMIVDKHWVKYTRYPMTVRFELTD
jgi:hypothetical protein